MTARRTADAMLRVLGATEVTLRIADPSSGDSGSQLGLAAPTASDVQIAPVLTEILPPEKDGTRSLIVTISAQAAAKAAEPYGAEDIGTWLLTSQGIVHEGKLLKVRSVRVDHFASRDYLYHVVASE